VIYRKKGDHSYQVMQGSSLFGICVFLNDDENIPCEEICLFVSNKIESKCVLFSYIIQKQNIQFNIKGILSHKVYSKRHLTLKYIFMEKVALKTYSSHTHT
jgi:hypothetical protein